MRRSFLWGGWLTLGGCAALGGLLGQLSDLLLLGVTPAANFATPNHPDRGKLMIAVGALEDSILPVRPLTKDLIVETDDGEELEIESAEAVDGHEKGSLALLVDGSGSNSASDPERRRVEAVKLLAEALHGCGPDWQMALLEFGTTVSGGFSDTRVVQGWTTETDAVVMGADSLRADGLTPLWDSAYEVLESLGEAHDSAFVDQPKQAGVGLVVFSDGEDSGSRRSPGDVAARAQALGIPVHTIGYGPASDLDAMSSARIVDDLRRLSEATGGYYGAVSTADALPELTEAVAMAHCGGHTQLVVTWPDAEPDQSYSGRLVYKPAKAVQAPFTFRAPR